MEEHDRASWAFHFQKVFARDLRTGDYFVHFVACKHLRQRQVDGQAEYPRLQLDRRPFRFEFLASELPALPHYSDKSVTTDSDRHNIQTRVLRDSRSLPEIHLL